MKFKDICVNKNATTKDIQADRIDRYVGLEHLKPEELDISSWGLTSEGTTFTRVFSPGQVLFGKRRSYQKKAAVASFKGVCSGDILVFEANTELLIPKLLPYIVQNDDFFNYAVGTSSGSLSPRTSWKHLSEYQLRIPKEKEIQEKILTQLLKLEDALNNKKRLIQSTRLYKEKLMQQVLTKGIGHTKFKKTDLGEIPVEWEVEAISNITNLIKDGSHNPPPRVEDGIPMLSAENIFSGKINFGINEKNISVKDFEEMHKFYRIERGDVLMTIVGTLGRTAIVETDKLFTLQRSVAIFKTNDRVTPQYFNYALNSSYVIKQVNKRANVTAQAGIYLKELAKLLIAVPPLQEQQKITKILSSIDEQIEGYEKEQTQLKEIKKAFLHQIF
ncbi:restriction endonuclease subunit S [Priestia megaterium]|uniref:restriction endonuclease subunit S n=1 Tax=Priestia megaterium TaxID=1404 RepID=UPI0019528A2D|nr:restriction endonuclease subunit S [Priestia megaterium]MBM6599552.1 restriction endonuclease subunit S [Priestia megaterium]